MTGEHRAAVTAVDADGTHRTNCQRCGAFVNAPSRALSAAWIVDHERHQAACRQAAIVRLHDDRASCEITGCRQRHSFFAYCSCGADGGWHSTTRAVVEYHKQAHRCTMRTVAS